MSDDILRDDDDKDFDPADLKKKGVLDLIEEDALDDDIKLADDLESEEEGDDSFALYEVDDENSEIYSY